MWGTPELKEAQKLENAAKSDDCRPLGDDTLSKYLRRVDLAKMRNNGKATVEFEFTICGQNSTFQEGTATMDFEKMVIRLRCSEVEQLFYAVDQVKVDTKGDKTVEILLSGATNDGALNRFHNIVKLKADGYFEDFAVELLMFSQARRKIRLAELYGEYYVRKTEFLKDE